RAGEVAGAQVGGGGAGIAEAVVALHRQLRPAHQGEGRGGGVDHVHQAGGGGGVVAVTDRVAQGVVADGVGIHQGRHEHRAGEVAGAQVGGGGTRVRERPVALHRHVTTHQAQHRCRAVDHVHQPAGGGGVAVAITDRVAQGVVADRVGIHV